MNKPTDTRNLINSRSAYLDKDTGVVIIIDPSRADSGTAFIPKNPVTGELDAVNYFYNVLK
jgi:hypothetical protein